MTALALVVFPALWQIPADLVYDWLVPEETRTAGTAPVLLDMASLLGTFMWGCILWGGQLLIAIDLANGEPVSLQRFLVGWPSAVRLFTTTIAYIPGLALIYMPYGGWSVWVDFSMVSVTVVGTAVLVARLFVLGPMLVDARNSPWESVVVSWRTTSRHTGMIIRLGVIMVAAVLPIALVEASISDEYFVTGGLFGAIFTLTAARLYVSLVTPAPGTSAA